jgi:hypothetical protein
MDVVLSKRLREVDEGEGQAKDCFVSFIGPSSLSQIDPSSLVICYGAVCPTRLHQTWNMVLILFS